MSRKHKSNRRRKITHSNVPAIHNDTQQQTEAEKNLLPEKASQSTEPTTDNALLDRVESQNLNVFKNNDVHESLYSLDAHYEAQETNNEELNINTQQQNNTVNSIENTPDNSDNENINAANDTAAASLLEYEQLKHKNRRRLVSAGALVLVAGSLFAAASKDKIQNDPSLSVVKVASQTVAQPEILRPAGSENKVDLNLDDINSPLKLENNTVATPQDHGSIAATQKIKNTRTTGTVKSNSTTPSPTINNDKNREEIRLAEERRQRAQNKANEAEAKRLAAEKEVASKARAAQANADRIRDNERTQLRAQLTTERATREKQRAQRQAIERANKTASNSGGSKAIQAGAFADKEAAKRLQQQLRDLNYNARLEEVQTNKGKVYRVRTGEFSNHSEAKNALTKMQKQGLSGMVVEK